MSKDKFKHYKVSQKIQFNPKEFSQIFSRFFRLSCHLWTQFSQLLKGQFGKFLCLSHREFPEVFKTPPTFLPTPFQSGVIAKKQDHAFFLGHPVSTSSCLTEPHFRAVFWYHLFLLRLLRNIKEAKSYLSNVAEILWHSPSLPHCSHYFSLTLASVLRQTQKLMLVSYFDSEGSPRKASQDSNTKLPQLV